MKHFEVTILSDAQRDFRRCVNYLLYVKKNRQAALNLKEDLKITILRLSDIAGSLRIADSEVLKSRNLKRLNFGKHNYFLLFRIEGNKAIVTNIFHCSEDFESKLS